MLQGDFHPEIYLLLLPESSKGYRSPVKSCWLRRESSYLVSLLLLLPTCHHGTNTETKANFQLLVSKATRLCMPFLGLFMGLLTMY
jgi:hypothetical protein